MMTLKHGKTACLVVAAFVCAAWAAGRAHAGNNVLLNGGFEQIDSNNKPQQWDIDAWQPGSLFTVTNTKVRSGKYAALLQSDTENDARFIQTIRVKSEKVYRLSGWVCTENIPSGTLGANLCVMNGFVHSQGITGSSDWTPLELIFRTYSGQRTVILGARLGFYGQTCAGKVYFDDLTLEELPGEYYNYQQIERPGSNQAPPPPGAGANISGQPGPLSTTSIYAFLTVLFYILALGGLWLLLRGKSRPPGRPGKKVESRFAAYLPWIFLALAAVSFLVRMPLFSAVPFTNDMDCFKAWALRMADLGPENFYAEGYFCDYPPVPLYLLWILGFLVKAFSLAGNPVLFTALIKLPAFFFDVGTAWLLFIMLRKKNALIAILLAGMYMFIPAVIYNSSFWGQVDSYYAFLMMLAFYLILRNELELASVCIVASLFTKTQTIAFFPILFFYLAVKTDYKRMLAVLWTALTTLVVIWFPFNWGRPLLIPLITVFLLYSLLPDKQKYKNWTVWMGTALAILAIVFIPMDWGKPLDWMLNHYTKQAAQYPYASFNAASFLSLLGGNTVNDSELTAFGVSYRVLGAFLFLAAAVWCCFYYWRKRTKGALALAFFISALAFFMFFPRMHERYMFPILPFMLLAAGYYRDKILYYCSTLLGLIYLLNMHAAILMLQNTLQNPVSSRIIYILSLLNTLLLAALLLRYHARLQGRKQWLRGFLSQTSQAMHNKLSGSLTTAPFPLGKKDYMILGAIVLAYTVLIFARLGTTHTPQTGLNMASSYEGVEVVLAQKSDISTVAWYDAEDTGDLQVQGFDGASWSNMTVLSCKDYYALKKVPCSVNQVERIRLIPQGSAGHINEIAFLDRANKLIPVKSTVFLINNREIPAEKSPLFDEQDTMLAEPSYMNSTYFDEIYHGRTAYEFVKGTQVYETTHPPLGKDILSLGILMFGMNPFGMRFMHALMGVILIITLFFLGRQVLATRFGAYAVMTMGALDFMPFVQSRYATIDTTSTVFIGLTYLFALKYAREQEQGKKAVESLPTLALMFFFFALAASVKWTAIYGFSGVALLLAIVKIRQYLAYRREYCKTFPAAKAAQTGKGNKKKSHVKTVFQQEAGKISMDFWRNNFGLTVVAALLLFLLIVPAVYFLTYIPFLNCKSVDAFSDMGVEEVKASQRDMYNYHSQLKDSHPFSSPWWSWPFNFKPLWIYPDKQVNVRPGCKVSIVSMGNPLIWFIGLCAVIIFVYKLLTMRRWSIMHYVMIGILSLYLPWVLVSRVTFIYHFYPVLPLIYLMGALLLESIWHTDQGRKIIPGILTAGFVLFILFYPVLSGLEVPQSYVDRLRWFPQDWIF
ncbi:MAG: glycosyltransferase family 39 protein [Bacillota bacterium]